MVYCSCLLNTISCHSYTILCHLCAKNAGVHIFYHEIREKHCIEKNQSYELSLFEERSLKNRVMDHSARRVAWSRGESARVEGKMRVWRWASATALWGWPAILWLVWEMRQWQSCMEPKGYKADFDMLEIRLRNPLDLLSSKTGFNYSWRCN